VAFLYLSELLKLKGPGEFPRPFSFKPAFSPYFFFFAVFFAAFFVSLGAGFLVAIKIPPFFPFRANY